MRWGNARLAGGLVLVAISSFGGCTCGTPPGSGGGFSRADAANVCAILEACFPSDWDQGVWNGSVSACTTDTRAYTFLPTPGNLGDPTITMGMEAPMHDVYGCLLTSGGDCSRAADCLALSGNKGTCSPADGLAAGTCQGKTLTGCSADGYGFGVDCGAYGEACGSMNLFFGQANVCGLAACSDHSKDRCDGTVAYACAGALMGRFDCASWSATCTKASDGSAECTGNASCDPSSQPTCDGTVQVECGLDGTQLRHDCASQATMRRCQGGLCIPSGTACTTDMAETCDGTKITFCDDGIISTVDCAALGFAGCQGGRCVPNSASGCAPGWTDCNGTCAELTSDPAHCGSCSGTCPADMVCRNSSCTYTDCRGTGCGYGTYCDTTTGKCTPGCQVDSDCDVNQVCDATNTCVCAPNYRMCGSICRANDSPFACGASCTVCPTSPNAIATCTSGTCGLDCSGNYHWCGTDCVSSFDPATCGQSCSPCPAPTNGTGDCVGGTCSITCNAGYHDAGGSCVANCTTDANCPANQYCGAGVCEACPVGATEIEPNDTQATAQVLSAGTTSGSWEVQGAVCGTDITDWYEIDLAAGGTVTWSATTTTGQIQVTVVYGNKSLGGGSCSSLAPCAPTQVTLNGALRPLYVEVQGVALPTGYTLDVTQP